MKQKSPTNYILGLLSKHSDKDQPAKGPIKCFRVSQRAGALDVDADAWVAYPLADLLQAGSQVLGQYYSWDLDWDAFPAALAVAYPVVDPRDDRTRGYPGPYEFQAHSAHPIAHPCDPAPGLREVLEFCVADQEAELVVLVELVLDHSYLYYEPLDAQYSTFSKIESSKSVNAYVSPKYLL
jgi:hypothetical protein